MNMHKRLISALIVMDFKCIHENPLILSNDEIQIHIFKKKLLIAHLEDYRDKKTILLNNNSLFKIINYIKG